MICLHCKKEFEPKRPSKKYCSNSCRVMFFKKNGKKNEPPAFQVKAALNEIRELVAEMKELQKASAITPQKVGLQVTTAAKYFYVERPNDNFQNRRIKSIEDYISDKENLYTDSDWDEFRQQVKSDSNLTDRQKYLLLNS